jgi:hypothetical protein
MPHPQDAYAVLGLLPGASGREIRRAFRTLVLELHPDRHPGDAGCTERLRVVVAAYESLIGLSRCAEKQTKVSASPPRFRDRFACPRCFDTFSHDSACPRCDLPLIDEWLRGPVSPASDPSVDAMLTMLERRAEGLREPYERFLKNVPIGICLTLLGGGVFALSIQVPIASMMLGYGVFLAMIQAFGTPNCDA